MENPQDSLKRKSSPLSLDDEAYVKPKLNTAEDPVVDLGSNAMNNSDGIQPEKNLEQASNLDQVEVKDTNLADHTEELPNSPQKPLEGCEAKNDELLKSESNPEVVGEPVPVEDANKSLPAEDSNSGEEAKTTEEAIDCAEKSDKAPLVEISVSEQVEG